MVGVFDVCKRMWECSSACPWHGEHEMNGNAQSLRTVYMCETDGVRNDGLRNKRRLRLRIRLDT